MKVGAKGPRNNPDQLHDDDAAWVRRYLRLADAAVLEAPVHPRIFTMNYAHLGDGRRPAAAGPPHHSARITERELEHPASDLRNRPKAG